MTVLSVQLQQYDSSCHSYGQQPCHFTSANVACAFAVPGDILIHDKHGCSPGACLRGAHNLPVVLATTEAETDCASVQPRSASTADRVACVQGMRGGGAAACISLAPQIAVKAVSAALPQLASVQLRMPGQINAAAPASCAR